MREGPSAAGALLLGWLGLTVIPLVAGGVTGARALVLAAHVAAFAAVLVLEGRRGRGGRPAFERVLADWHLLLLLPALYAELPWLMAGVTEGYHDATVVAAEAWLFGGQPAFEWAGAWPWRGLSEGLHAAYLAYYPLIYVPPLLLYARGRVSEHGETVVALGLSMLACYAVFVVWPVQGPRYLGVPTGIPHGPVRGAALALLEAGSSRGAAFPSSHVSVAVTQTLVALRLQPRTGAVLAVVTPLLAAGAVYGGFHYATDVVAGALVGVAAAAAGPLLHRVLGERIRREGEGFTGTDDGL